MHEVEVSGLAVDRVVEPLYAHNAVGQNAQDEVAALVILYAIELQGPAGHVHILHIHLRRYDQRIPHELPLDYVPLNAHGPYGLQLIVNENHLLQAHHATQLPTTRPHNVNHYIREVQTHPQVPVHLVVYQLCIYVDVV